MALDSSSHSVLVHLHAHRSSGTSMCAMARDNGMRVPDFGCNPFSEAINNATCERIRGSVMPFMYDAQQTCRWGETAASRTAWAAAAGNIQFVGEEFYGLPPWADLYGHSRFVYSTTFRHPLNRMASDWFGSMSDSPPTPWLSLASLPDNLMTRIMSSDRLMALSHRRVLWDHDYFRTPGAVEALRLLPVDEAAYRLARQNLQKLSVVLLLEDLPGTLPLMAYKFNWTKVASPVHANGRSGVQDFLDSLNDSNRYQIEILAKNVWDLRLYADAIVIAIAQLEEAVANCPTLDRCKQYVPRMQHTLDHLRNVTFSLDTAFLNNLCLPLAHAQTVA